MISLCRALTVLGDVWHISLDNHKKHLMNGKLCDLGLNLSEFHFVYKSMCVLQMSIKN